MPPVYQKDVVASCSFVSHHHSRALHQVGVDFMTCNQVCAGGHRYIIVTVYYFTKWVEEIPTFKADGEMTMYF